MQRLQPTHPLAAFPQLRRLHFFSPQNQALVATSLAHLRARHVCGVDAGQCAPRPQMLRSADARGSAGHSLSGPDADRARSY